jgi:hypothetical protein
MILKQLIDKSHLTSLPLFSILKQLNYLRKVFQLNFFVISRKYNLLKAQIELFASLNAFNVLNELL